MKKLAIIIINYNGLDNTIECLKSLKSLKWKGKLQIIVVDNDSDQSLDSLKKQFPHITLIKNKGNPGFAEGNNIGAKRAIKNNAELIMLLNNDTKVDPHLAQELEKADADIATPKIYFYKGFEFHKHHYQPSELGKVIWYAGGYIDWDNITGIHIGVDTVDRGQFGDLKEIEFATGCCMLIKKQVIDKIGLFDKKYFLYLEDADFSIRARKAGFIIHYQPKAVLWHKNAESTGGSGSSLQDYYFTRNRLLFGSRFAQPKTKFALTRESFKLLLTGTKWQKRGVIDFYLRKFGKGSYK